ncbi:MAG TPA: hypothetical protein VIY72_16280 [Acidimicrobiales bacterium]
MTDPTADGAVPPRRRTRRPAVASRIAVAGMSLAAGCAIVTAFALGQPVEGATAPPADPTPTVPLPTTTAAPPPTTIVVNRIYVPVPAGDAPPAGASRSGVTSQAGGGSAVSGRPASSPGAATPPPSAAAPAAAPAAVPAPVARTRAS